MPWIDCVRMCLVAGVRRLVGGLWLCCLPALAMAQAPEAAPAGATKFDILEYVVEGNTVLPVIDIERAVYPHLGPDRNANDVDAARDALQQVYQDAGYLSVAVSVPAQRVNSGVVVLKVTEGKIEGTKISGAKYTLPSRLRAATPSLAAGQVPNFNDMQVDLADIGRNPDLRVTPLLRSGKAPGAVEIELALEDESPLHGSLELNNKRSADTRTGRLEGAVRYDNLWQRRHSLGLNYFGSPTNRDDVEVWGLNYAMPLAKGTLAAFFAHSDSDVPTAFGTQSIGNGDTTGFRWIKPLRALPAYFHSVSLGMDWKSNRQRTVLDDGFSLSQPMEYATFVAQYNSGWMREHSQWRFGVGFHFGVRGLNERRIDCNGVTVDQFECRRPGSDPGFSVLRADAEYRYAFLDGWRVVSRVDLQRASGPLVNTEQFSAGGFDSVRGYLEGERQADDGLRVTVELQTPSRDVPGLGLPARLMTFYDWAQLETQEAIAGQTPSAILGSAGVGLVIGEPRGLSADLSYAHTFFAGASGPGRTRDGDNSALVRIRYVF